MSKTSYNEILVISVGITPQIVTETLFYYYKLTKTVREFSKIVLVTTKAGEEKLIEELFNNKWLNKLEKRLGLKSNQIPLTEDDIHVIKDDKDNPIWDVRNTEESKFETKLLFHLFQELTSDVDSRLTVTVAGGRKSMGVSTGLALQLFGRYQDEMIHIIVPQERFNDKKWFFPEDPKSESEKIEISDIPYIKIRKLLSDTLNVEDPDTLLEIAQTKLDEVSPIENLVIRGDSIIIDEMTIQIRATWMIIWRILARLKIENCVRPELKYCGNCTDCFISHSEMLDMYEEEFPEEYGNIKGFDSYAYKGWRGVNIDEPINKINKARGLFNKRDISKTEKENYRLKLVDLEYEYNTTIDKQVRNYRSNLNGTIKDKVKNYNLKNQLTPIKVNNKFGLSIDKNAIEFEDELD